MGRLNIVIQTWARCLPRVTLPVPVDTSELLGPTGWLAVVRDLWATNICRIQYTAMQEICKPATKQLGWLVMAAPMCCDQHTIMMHGAAHRWCGDC